MKNKSLPLMAIVFFACSCGSPTTTPVYHADNNSLIIRSGSSVIEVSISNGPFDATREQLLRWVDTAAQGVSHFLGKFPVEHVRVIISASGDGTSIDGVENGGESVHLSIGRHVSPDQLADDWTMTHEMLHLAFPSLSSDHTWMNEGLSVYLEPIVRARSGIVSTKRYWRELHDGLATGQPEPGDAGLDRTHTWARTYWGGTIFWFLADIEIRRQTNGQKSLDDVIRKILNDGGDGSVDWPIQRVLDTGDAETGTHVLNRLYNRLALNSETVSFDSLWKELGIRYTHYEVQFDDTAPLAWMRKAITAPDGRGMSSSTPR